MIVKKKTYDMSVEARADELENRVTKMNIENAKMLRKTAAYECGLNEVMSCSDVEHVRDRVYQLQLIAGRKQCYTYYLFFVMLNKYQLTSL